MIVSRVPAVAYRLQPTELQTDSRKKISRVSNSHRLLNRTTIIIGSVGFFSLLLFVSADFGALHEKFIYPTKTTYTNTPFLKRASQVCPFVTRKAPQTRGYCVWSRVRIYHRATKYKPCFLKGKSCQRETKNGAGRLRF